jgi:hypothetical protein
MNYTEKCRWLSEFHREKEGREMQFRRATQWEDTLMGPCMDSDPERWRLKPEPQMSEQPKYTPGPWAQDDSDGADWGWIRDGEGRMVAVCGIPEGADLIKHRRDGSDPTEANARLIAAAPDLLEALKRLCDLPCNCPCEIGADEMTAYGQARAAIAKAEGRGK